MSFAVAVVVVGGLALVASPAHASVSASSIQKEVVTSADPKVGCEQDIANGVVYGEVCVHIWGNAGQQGRIAVSYHKFTGGPIWASVRWYNRSTGRGRLLVNLDWMSAGFVYSGYFDTFLGPDRNVAVLDIFDPGSGQVAKTVVSREVVL